MADGTTQGRESVSWTRQRLKNNSKWIPAFAGMTIVEAFVENKNEEKGTGSQPSPG
jgi:hypothetical protein